MIVRRSAAPSPRPPSRGMHVMAMIASAIIAIPQAAFASVTTDWLTALDICRKAVETAQTFKDFGLSSGDVADAQSFVVAATEIETESGFVLTVVPGISAPLKAWRSPESGFLIGEWPGKCTVKPLEPLSAQRMRELWSAAREDHRKMIATETHRRYDLGMPNSSAVKLVGRNGQGRCVVSYVVLAESENKLFGTSGEQMEFACTKPTGPHLEPTQ